MPRLASCSVVLASVVVSGLAGGLASQLARAERLHPRPFIVGGDTAKIADFPYQVGLLLSRRDDSTDSSKVNQYRCGGSLISSEWVLTAAHCFVSYDSTTRTGVAYLDGDDVSIKTGADEFYSNQMVITAASSVIPHDEYDPADLDKANVDDIALIKAKTKVTNGTPVALALLTPVQGNAVVTGWGRTSETGTVSSVLKKATLPLVSNETCNETGSSRGKISDGMLCAGDLKGGTDACKGDSGGPLVQSQQGFDGTTSKVQVGIVSYGEGCARANEYGVYTRVSAYLDWIAMAIIRNDIDSAVAGNLSLTWLHPALSQDRVKFVATTVKDLSDPLRATLMKSLIAGYYEGVPEWRDNAGGRTDIVKFGRTSQTGYTIKSDGTLERTRLGNPPPFVKRD